jgi:predicted nucleic acid-binding protein
LDAAVLELDAMNYEVHHMPYTVPGLVQSARTYMLQGYDAVYFDLAKRQGIPLASLDRGHKTACRSLGVNLLKF